MYVCSRIMNMNKDILRLALPAIFTNITIPLLGLIDFSIAGHLDDVKYIGAIAIGTMIFNVIYWNFSFLRMGTTGITAQYYGKDDSMMASITLYRALFIAITIGLLIWIFQFPLYKLAILLLSPSTKVEEGGRMYFKICIWGSPFLLSTLVLKGWFLGMQNAKFPMIIAIMINVFNIVLSLCAVFVFKVGFIGIAIGTVCSEIMGLILAIALLLRKYRHFLRRVELSNIFKGSGISKFFHINSDIFFRSFFLLSVNLTFTAIGARAGDMVLAVNSLIMQLFFFYSYFMDGFAYAGEAIVGKYKGANNHVAIVSTVKHLFIWGIGVVLVFTLVYGLFLPQISYILAPEEGIVDGMMNNWIWCVLIPIVGVSAFIWDGVFVGLTATRQMLTCTLFAAVAFFTIYFTGEPGYSNIRLWIAFLSFLMIRGVVLNTFFIMDKKIR